MFSNKCSSIKAGLACAPWGGSHHSDRLRPAPHLPLQSLCRCLHVVCGAEGVPTAVHPQQRLQNYCLISCKYRSIHGAPCCSALIYRLRQTPWSALHIRVLKHLSFDEKGWHCPMTGPKLFGSALKRNILMCLTRSKHLSALPRPWPGYASRHAPFAGSSKVTAMLRLPQPLCPSPLTDISMERTGFHFPKCEGVKEATAL